MPSLHWTGKDEAVVAVREVPYRPLVAVPSLDYGDADTDNLLIQGDNLDALKSLLPVYAGRVKCIFIDPPYNTHSAFEHYDDNREHSIWLSLMYPRLELLRELLSEDGSIWVTIDDNEGHYLKVIMDEVFTRQCFVIDITWQKRDGPPNDRKIASIGDHILVWGKALAAPGGKTRKTLAEERFNLMPRTEKANAQYQVFAEPDGPDERGPFRKIDTTANGKGGRFVESLFYPILNPYTGEEVWPRKGTCWRHNREEMQRLAEDRRLFWGVKGTAKTPMRKLFEHEAKQGMTTPSIWTEAGMNQHASGQLEALFGEKAFFETPKPEELLARIVTIATNAHDIVLDSFLGSGTTAAVAHKTGRRWIGVEMGDHAETHCAARLRKVIDGDQGGISEAVGWKGGGGFRFCRLGEPVFDGRGSIRAGVGFADLAQWIWYRETRQPLAAVPASPLLGAHRGTAFYLLFNGILGDRRPDGGNVLTAPVLDALPRHDGPRVVFGEACRLHESRLAALGVRFKQLPYQANG